MCITICSLCLSAFPYVVIIFTRYPSQAALLTPNQLLCQNVLTWQLFWDGPSQRFSNLNNEQSPLKKKKKKLLWPHPQTYPGIYLRNTNQGNQGF